MLCFNGANVADCSASGVRWRVFGACVIAFLLSPTGCRRGGDTPVSARGDANVLLITLDTARADHLSCYFPLNGSRDANSQYAKTPHLDALAARGVLFAHATAQAPLTLPSHASIMTGKYPRSHGLRDMEGFVLDPAHATLASTTRRNGFATAAIVGSRVLAKPFGLANGFAFYDDAMEAEGSGHPGTFAERRAAMVTDHALEWLQDNGQSRFFLWAHYFDPHAPYDPPDPYRKNYARDPYSGEIAYTDEQVGRLLDGLERFGLASRTLVAVIGDHGESLGEHGEATHGVFLYDSTLHVPFILAGPGIPGGKVIREQVRSIDLLPTVLAFLKLPAEGEVEGVNLWPLIRQGAPVRSHYSYSETLYPRIYMGWSDLAAIRTDNWKLIVAPRPELYHLTNDPGERQNLINTNPDQANSLRSKLPGLARGRQEPLVARPMDATTRRQLESLGYLSGGTPRQIRLDVPAPDPKDRVEVLKLLVQAEDFLTSKDYAAAARLMEKGLRLDPANPRCHISLAMAYEQMGKYQRAIEVFQHAIHRRIETDKIYSRLGIDYLHLGQFDKAVEALERSSQINPADLDNLRNLGMAYLQLGRVNGAERVFRAIITQNDRHGAAHNGLGLVAIRRGDVETARREFERAVAADANEVKSLLDLGILYQSVGNGEQALRYFQMFLRKAPPGQFTDQVQAVREAVHDLEAARKRAAEQ
jgi:arylsulfatase A-like enzyme/Tfp pilus assembly protein PilF